MAAGTSGIAPQPDRLKAELQHPKPPVIGRWSQKTPSSVRKFAERAQRGRLEERREIGGRAGGSEARGVEAGEFLFEAIKAGGGDAAARGGGQDVRGRPAAGRQFEQAPERRE